MGKRGEALFAGLLLQSLLVPACGDDSAMPDGGSAIDSAMLPDAGRTDAGPGDAGSSPDSGSEPDAGMSMDAGPSDSGSSPDSGSSSDSGPTDSGEPDASPPADGGRPAELVITPATADYGSVGVGSSATGDLTVTNIGDLPTGVIAFELATTGHFSLVATDCTSLGGSESCSVTVRFAPTSTGTKVGTLTASATPGGSDTADLTGLGVSCGVAPLMPSPHDFGTATVGTLGPTQTFTATNTGSVAATIESATVDGSHPADFPIIADGCTGTDVAPGGSCTLDVRFEPSAAGSRAASLALIIPGACGRPTAYLSGVGAD